MITKDDYAKLLTMELDIVRSQTEGLTHADSLLQPQPAGNCLNWVMGHLVDNLAEILKNLGGTLPDNLLDLSKYGYNSEPIRGDGPGVHPLPVLLDSYEQLTHQITEQLAEMADPDFDAQVEFWQGKTRLGYYAFFYFFHNSYHVGQLEQLRNLAGRTEKVI